MIRLRPAASVKPVLDKDFPAAFAFGHPQCGRQHLSSALPPADRFGPGRGLFAGTRRSEREDDHGSDQSE